MAEGRPRAVVIEDDDDVRGLVQAVLAAAGVQVDALAAGPEGIEAVREHGTDLVVLDYGLPHMDGAQVAAGIRAISAVPILLLTGREDLVRDLPAGVTDAMAKPFTVAELRQRVQALLP
ncbi:response regulator transcription factor [Sinomonas atrocyanea]